MPAYGFLFRDQRGSDLVAYLESLQGNDTEQHLDREKQWQPSASSIAQANEYHGEGLYRRDCSTCHNTNGATRRVWQSSFQHLPVELPYGPYAYFSPSDSEQQRFTRLAQIAKFGIPGTDMPGHEYLSDRDIDSISLWLTQAIAQSNRKQ
jgi:cytochrome c oxidase cbb3-type subunit 2